MLTRVGLGLSVAGPIVVLALLHGGYAPVAWGWSALAGFWVSILALAFGSQHVIDGARLAFFIVLTALAGWTALSATWSLSVPRTMLELERDLTYVGIVTGVLLVAGATRRAGLISGVTVGLVAVGVYSLGRYLVTPAHIDPTQGYLLSEPIGYANGLGGLLALALPLTLAFAAQNSRAAVTALAGASTVLLGVALYLTQNRTGWLALGVALVVWFLRTDAPTTAAASTLVLAVPAGAAVAVVAVLDLLNTHRDAADVGTRRIAAGVVVAALAAIAAALAPRAPRLRTSRLAVIRAAQTGGLLVVVALGVALSKLGDRAHYWRVAWHVFERHPLLGSGGGTFDEQWFRYRDIGRTVREAHSLYLETLSELGLPGFLLLTALLALPIVVARRSRDPLLTAALASYCAFLVHAGFEWDWELPAVTVSGLMLALALLLSNARAPARIGGVVRLAGAAVAAAVAAFVVVALAGNSYIVAAEHRILAGDVEVAAARAKRARQLIPWASEPWLVIADTRTRSGDPAGARAALRNAVTRDPADWTLWLRLAAASRGDQRTVALRRTLVLNPRLDLRRKPGP